MASRDVILVLFFITYVQAAPAPAKVSLIKNSSLGFGVAALDSKTTGVLQDINTSNDEVKVEKVEGDVALIENVNHGTAVAIAGSIAFGLIKDNIIVGKDPFWRQKKNEC